MTTIGALGELGEVEAPPPPSERLLPLRLDFSSLDAAGGEDPQRPNVDSLNALRSRFSRVVSLQPFTYSTSSLLSSHAPSPVHRQQSSSSTDMGSFGQRNLSSPVHLARHSVMESADTGNFTAVAYLSPDLTAHAIFHGNLLSSLTTAPNCPPPNSKPTLLFDDLVLLSQLLTIDDSFLQQSALTGLACGQYAALVLEHTLLPSATSAAQSHAALLALDLGPQICELLLKRLSSRNLSPALERALAQRIPRCLLSTHSAEGYQIAFTDASDSRHHFKTNEQRDLYTNREAVRDEFLRLRNRAVLSAQTLGAQNPSWSDFVRNARAVMEKLDPGNMAWFAQLFVRHLVMDHSEVDKDVKKLANGEFFLESNDQRSFQATRIS